MKVFLTVIAAALAVGLMFVVITAETTFFETDPSLSIDDDDD
jgi:hypothetical protein